MVLRLCPKESFLRQEGQLPRVSRLCGYSEVDVPDDAHTVVRTEEVRSNAVLQLLFTDCRWVIRLKEIVARLVFCLNEKQARLPSLQVCILIRTHRTLVPEPVTLDPSAYRIGILTPKLAWHLDNCKHFIERSHTEAVTIASRRHLLKLL